MGNKLGRRRQVVGERYTRPQGLYQHRDIDHKKLRKLILDSKLAPCYPGDEESALDLEECLICFLYYPSLNRSRCCKKGICTECFLQLKPSDSSRPTQCPFCNTRNYAVEYHGVRTKEEKGMELLEEQRVIEAQIRVRQQELQEEERMQKQRELNSSRRIQTPAEVEYWDIPSSSASESPLLFCDMPSLRHPTPSTEVIFSQDSWTVPASTRPLHSRKHREDNCDLDLEDIMVMEAIWLSIQDHGTQRDSGSGANALSAPSFSEDCCHSNAVASIEASTSGGLAYAVAALAERQSMLGDSTYEIGMGTSSATFHMLQRSGSLPTENERVVEPYPPESWIEVSPRSGSAAVSSTEENEWAIDHVSEIAEAGTSDVSSNITVDGGQGAFSPPGGISVAGASQLLPDSFEEQMMLAMVISLAEVRARTNPQGLTWM